MITLEPEEVIDGEKSNSYEQSVESRDDVNLHNITNKFYPRCFRESNMAIVIVEGVDGVGKTTFINKLVHELSEVMKNESHVTEMEVVKFPSDIVKGEMVYRFADDYIDFQYECLEEINGFVELLKFNKEAMEKDTSICRKIFILDRFIASNEIYAQDNYISKKGYENYPERSIENVRKMKDNVLSFINETSHINVLLTITNFKKMEASLRKDRDMDALDAIHLPLLGVQQNDFIANHLVNIHADSSKAYSYNIRVDLK